jgi:hypothetical protein
VHLPGVQIEVVACLHDYSIILQYLEGRSARRHLFDCCPIPAFCADSFVNAVDGIRSTFAPAIDYDVQIYTAISHC